MAIDETGEEEKEGEEGDRWAGQEASSPGVGEMLGLHLLPSALPPNPTPLLRGFRWSFYHSAGYRYMDSLAVN